MKNKYLLKYHTFFCERMRNLITAVEKLYQTLPTEQYRSHELTKLLARITKAHVATIPADPNHPSYFLKGDLSKFRRYKRGLQRYRLIYCFANNPAIIVYLYINDKDHLRKEGNKNDPYSEFAALYHKGIFSHNPHALNMQNFINDAIV